MKIGIIGAGNVGSALAKKLSEKGHPIYLGVRDLSSATPVAGTTSCSVKQAIENSDVVILATPWSVAEQLVKSHASALKEKILIDCTNPLKPDLSGLEVGHTHSGGEIIQQAALEAKVFKAFNSTGFNIMESPTLEQRKAVMFFCGDDLASRKIVQKIVEDVGFESVDAGPLKNSRLLEPLALLWISCAYKFGMGRDFAFSIIKRDV